MRNGVEVRVVLCLLLLGGAHRGEVEDGGDFFCCHGAFVDEGLVFAAVAEGADADDGVLAGFVKGEEGVAV